jgi:hypothetical protein
VTCSPLPWIQRGVFGTANLEDYIALLAEGRLSESGAYASSAPQQAQPRDNVVPHYHAFISYSRAADGRLAPVVQSALQRFAKPWYRRQILRIFRDQTSLEMTPDVWPEIRRALDASEFFILLASPEAALSRWVALEVEHWLSHKPLDRVLIVLTSGSLVWDPKSDRFDPQQSDALPLPLLIHSTGLPNYADLSTLHQSEQLDLKNPAFLDAVASLAARIHNRPKDELTGEEVRQHRRFRVVATVRQPSSPFWLLQRQWRLTLRFKSVTRPAPPQGGFSALRHSGA